MSKSIWRRFNDGERIAKASLQVINLVRNRPQQAATIYRIRFLPCGCEAELSHAQIKKRMREDTKKCQICKPSFARAEMHRLDKNFAQARPCWPISPLVRASVKPGWEWS